MKDMNELTQSLGKLQGTIEALEKAQRETAANVRDDIRRLHERLESITVEGNNRTEKLFREGCSKAGGHEDHENRVREIENWKVSHDAESRATATSAGGAAGAKWGTGVAAAVSAVLAWLLNYLHKGG